jgi:hypothetical protein
MEPSSVAECRGALDVPGSEPVAVCSLVGRVERIELVVGGLRREMRSQGRRLALIVGAMGAVSPHLVAVLEWVWSRASSSIGSVALALLG